MATFATPDYSHLTQGDYENVYEPAEDTFLLMDALEQDVDNIRKLRPSICVEVGCGSGLVITFLAKMLNNSALCMATDCNPLAAACAKRTANQNQVTVEVVTSDLVHALQPQLKSRIDILLFNPPYVVTPSEENLTPCQASLPYQPYHIMAPCNSQPHTNLIIIAITRERQSANLSEAASASRLTPSVRGKSIAANQREEGINKNNGVIYFEAYRTGEMVGSSSIASSWAGGVDGREVIDRLLPQIPEMLSVKGLFYLLLLRENKPDDIRKTMANMGFQSEIVLQRRTGPEHLSIIKFYREQER